MSERTLKPCPACDEPVARPKPIHVGFNFIPCSHPCHSAAQDVVEAAVGMVFTGQRLEPWMIDFLRPVMSAKAALLKAQDHE